MLAIDNSVDFDTISVLSLFSDIKLKNIRSALGCFSKALSTSYKYFRRTDRIYVSLDEIEII